MQALNRPWVPALALLLIGFALTLPWLGNSGLWDPWEPKYAQTAREMGERGDWVVPHYREDPRLVKPPLTYWMIGASQSLFGVTEFAARLPGALLAALARRWLRWCWRWPSPAGVGRWRAGSPERRC